MFEEDVSPECLVLLPQLPAHFNSSLPSNLDFTLLTFCPLPAQGSVQSPSFGSDDEKDTDKDMVPSIYSILHSSKPEVG